MFSLVCKRVEDLKSGVAPLINNLCVDLLPSLLL